MAFRCTATSLGSAPIDSSPDTVDSISTMSRWSGCAVTLPASMKSHSAYATSAAGPNSPPGRKSDRPSERLVIHSRVDSTRRPIVLGQCAQRTRQASHWLGRWRGASGDLTVTGEPGGHRCTTSNRRVSRGSDKSSVSQPRRWKADVQPLDSLERRPRRRPGGLPAVDPSGGRGDALTLRRPLQ